MRNPNAPKAPYGMRWSPNLRRYEKYTGQPEGQGTPGTDSEPDEQDIPDINSEPDQFME